MKKVLFVDHSGHKITRSADFFLDVVGKYFQVDIYYLTPESHVDLGVIEAAASADIVILWQMDFLAPVFLAQGKPTVVIPMYDGSGGLPSLHWLAARSARFINFSLALHERIRMTGCQSLLLRYFPTPASEQDLPRFDQLKGFFWQRRPDHGVDFNYVNGMIGLEMDALHVHTTADIPGDFTPSVPDDITYSYTSSNWFVRKDDYYEQLAKSNVFVAPRVAEGIGMALLEAMARGMLVLAHDDATHDEYISNWVNGILFDKNIAASPMHIRTDAARLGRMAWKTVVEGHQQWLASHESIIEWIDGIPAVDSVDVDIRELLIDVWYSYYASLSDYTAFLHRNVLLISKISNIPLIELMESMHASGRPLFRRDKYSETALDDGILDVRRTDNKFIGSGWSVSEGEWRWVDGVAADLKFSLPVRLTNKVAMTFTAKSLRNLGKKLHCTIFINDSSLFDGYLTPDWSNYAVTFDPVILKINNSIQIILGDAMSPPGDMRSLSAAFKEFVFSYSE